MNKKEAIQQHKIALMISLLYDHTENVNSQVFKLTGEVLDDLYSVKDIQRSNYLQKLSNEYINRLGSNIYVMSEILLNELIKVRANNKKALKLIVEISKMIADKKVEFIETSLKVDTIIRKNYETLSRENN